MRETERLLAVYVTCKKWIAPKSVSRCPKPSVVPISSLFLASTRSKNGLFSPATKRSLIFCYFACSCIRNKRELRASLNKLSFFFFSGAHWINSTFKRCRRQSQLPVNGAQAYFLGDSGEQWTKTGFRQRAILGWRVWWVGGGAGGGLSASSRDISTLLEGLSGQATKQLPVR